jgi:DNA-binding response OmpR family regulator
MAARILLVDDEDAVRRMLAFPLERDGHHVTVARDGEAALEKFQDERFDLVLLDVGLPKLDGMEVARRLRARSTVPIIMLTARSDEFDKVLGLELGADDYITKPFSLRELRSRIRAVLRRQSLAAREQTADERIETDGLVIDPARREVVVRDAPVTLTYVEFELLKQLASNPGRAFTRPQLLELVWGDSDYRDPRTIDVHVRHLREKIEEKPSEPDLIQTVRHVGYRFKG